MNKWNGLSKSAKIGIGGSAIGVAALATCLLGFCCIKQRAAGRKEREAADREYEKQTAELLAWRTNMNQQRAEQMRNGQGPHMGGIGGQMKRMSQSLGLGSPYKGDYQRF